MPLFTSETTDKTFRTDPFLRSHLLKTTNRYPDYDMSGMMRPSKDRANINPRNSVG